MLSWWKMLNKKRSKRGWIVCEVQSILWIWTWPSEAVPCGSKHEGFKEFEGGKHETWHGQVQHATSGFVGSKPSQLTGLSFKYQTTICGFWCRWGVSIFRKGADMSGLARNSYSCCNPLAFKALLKAFLSCEVPRCRSNDLQWLLKCHHAAFWCLAPQMIVILIPYKTMRVSWSKLWSL